MRVKRTPEDDDDGGGGSQVCPQQQYVHFFHFFCFISPSGDSQRNHEAIYMLVFTLLLTVSAEIPLIAALVAQKMNAGVCGFEKKNK